MLRTTQDFPVSVHGDIALHTVTVSLFTDVLLHTIAVSLLLVISEMVTWTSIPIYHFDISSLAVRQDCVTHKNLVYDLARHESSIAQW